MTTSDFREYVTLQVKQRPIRVNTPLGTVYISAGLVDSYGRRNDSVLLVPNNCGIGDNVVKVVRRGERNMRLVELKKKIP